MKNTFHMWSTLGDKTVNEIIPIIITNANLEILEHDLCIIDQIGSSDQKLKLLDFGCGIGRDVFGFSQCNNNWNIVGYDNDVMLEKSKEYCKLKFKKEVGDFPNVSFSSDWETVKQMKFDCIYSILVFQHIFEEDLCKYIQDIKKMTNKLVVSGRRYNDDIDNIDKSSGQHKNTWKILENNGLIPYQCIGVRNDVFGEIPYERDGNPNEHLTGLFKL